MVAGLVGDGARYFAVVVVCMAIAVISTALRMWCKAATMKNGLQSFHADDWMLVATTVTYLGVTVSTFWGLFDGSNGMEMSEIIADLQASPSPQKVQKMENYLESLFIGNTILYFTFYLAKLAVCLMYRRIFSTQPFRKMCLVLMIIATMWFVATEVANFCICIPVDIFWHRMKPGRCLNFNTFALIVGIIDVVIDAVILVLPVRAVVSLQLPTRTKVIVCGIFLLGSFAVITNILKVAYQYQPNAFYVNFTKASIWLNVHAAVSILCASMPTYNPVRDLLVKFASSIRETYGSSLRFIRSNRNRGGAGSSKASTDGEHGTHGLGLHSEQKSHYAEASYVPYHFPGRDNSSTMELVSPPPNSWANARSAGWHEIPGDDQQIAVPPGAIARTTRVEVV